jgi:hypothetical protein
LKYNVNLCSPSRLWAVDSFQLQILQNISSCSSREVSLPIFEATGFIALSILWPCSAGLAAHAFLCCPYFAIFVVLVFLLQILKTSGYQ